MRGINSERQCAIIHRKTLKKNRKIETYVYINLEKEAKVDKVGKRKTSNLFEIIQVPKTVLPFKSTPTSWLKWLFVTHVRLPGSDSLKTRTWYVKTTFAQAKTFCRCVDWSQAKDVPKMLTHLIYHKLQRHLSKATLTWLPSVPTPVLKLEHLKLILIKIRIIFNWPWKNIYCIIIDYTSKKKKFNIFDTI